MKTTIIDNHGQKLFNTLKKYDFENEIVKLTSRQIDNFVYDSHGINIELNDGNSFDIYLYENEWFVDLPNEWDYEQYLSILPTKL